jgi:hypothetical protein
LADEPARKSGYRLSGYGVPATALTRRFSCAKFAQKQDKPLGETAMLRAEDNQFLTESRAGTGMGELLRRFWLPVWNMNAGMRAHRCSTAVHCLAV